MSGDAALARLREGGKRALALALADIERDLHGPETAALLDAAFDAPHGRTIGITGPPGVGKSTLVDGLISRLRKQGNSVAVIAIDPSSARTGGAILGDRARFASLDPLDKNIFVRSMATRGRLGGLSDLVFPALVLMQAVYDIVLVETVGVGQSEIEISGLADTTVLCVQPASGDSLQFLKSGVMEVPDIVLVTKSDIGSAARRAAADLRSALSVTQGGGLGPQVLLCSSRTGEGLDEAVESLMKTGSDGNNILALREARTCQFTRWHRQVIEVEFGKYGLALLRGVCKEPIVSRVFAGHADLLSRMIQAHKTLTLSTTTEGRSDNAKPEY